MGKNGSCQQEHDRDGWRDHARFLDMGRNARRACQEQENHRVGMLSKNKLTDTTRPHWPRYSPASLLLFFDSRPSRPLWCSSGIALAKKPKNVSLAFSFEGVKFR